MDLDDLLCCQKYFQTERREAGKHLHAIGRFQLRTQRFHRRKRGLPAFHGVDDILLHGLEHGFVHRAKEHVYFRGAHERALPLRNELNALACRVRALVKLAGQGFHRKHGGSVRFRQRFIGVVHRRFGEHVRHTLAEQRFGYALNIITVEQPKLRNPGKAEERLQLAQQCPCLVGLRGFFFNKNTVNHASPYPACAASARAPMSFL